jgi:FkbM family methyltransferase
LRNHRYLLLGSVFYFMANYWCKNWGPKLRTFGRTLQRIENWPAAVALRVFRQRQKIRLLSFRSGLNVLCRSGVDWPVVADVALLDNYERGLRFIEQHPGQPLVLDLGANIGLFSLLVTQRHPCAEVYAYEPALPSMQILEAHRLLNPSLGNRIQTRLEGVGGSSRLAKFFYDEQSPQSSGFSQSTSTTFEIQIRAFGELVQSMSQPVALVKLDIEGSEYEILRDTNPSIWQRISAISMEIHPDPAGKMQIPEFLDAMSALGFRHYREPVGPATYFFHRA